MSNLRPSGAAGANVATQLEIGEPVIEFAGNLGPFGSWPDQAHLSSKHVDELGKFVDALSRGWTYRTLQRGLDLICGSVLLAVALIPLGIAAVAIKLESPGPVLYRQRRLGKGDKPFIMNKLRSMRNDAESDCGAVFTSDDDDRITRTGYFIRRTRLDELPQLWNVLRGEMSLVGPRAERPEFAETLSDSDAYYSFRISVRPGITGWAQTRYGYVNNVEAYEEKLALDLHYLKDRSILLDLTILAQTIKTVLHFRGM